MPDALTTITKLINSPPGQLAAGGVLAGIVWKFFERVGVEAQKKVEPWPATFAKTFDPIFGTFNRWRSWWVTVLAVGISIGIAYTRNPAQFDFVKDMGADTGARIMVIALVVVYWIPSIYYGAVLKASLLLRWCSKRQSGTSVLLALLIDFIVTLGIGIFLGTTPFGLMSSPNAPESIRSITYTRPYDSLVVCVFKTPAAAVCVYPAFAFSLWLWLYAGSGFILKAARRFDIGFDWFNRKFDIEKKPLQSIGLVAGALVAVLYWAAVIVSRMV